MGTNFNDFITWLDGLVWGLPLIVLIMAVGIYLTIRLNVLQIIHLPKALKYMFKNEEGGTGEVSSFGALCTALSATIGTGNIVGVATAIVAGGPGALFWMWIAAFFGMATKYAEGLLAIKYRHIEKDGHVLGGPFYYIEKGMGSKFKWLAKLFAFFGACAGLLGIGTFTQVHGITSAVNNYFDSYNPPTITLFGNEYSIIIIISGIVITLCVGLVLIGGIQRISSFAQIIVPFMAIAYILICFILLFNNYKEIPRALNDVFSGAFGLRAVAGGALGSIMVAMQKGIARGIFSNESGLGSAPIAAAAAKTNEPARQGLVSMTGTFIDTIIICTMTGLSIILTNAWDIGLEGVAVTAKAFQLGLPFSPWVASMLLMLCLVFFAFTTIIGWNYYSERCLEYLVNGNQRPIKVYRWVYILAVFIGPYMTVGAVWGIADIFNGLMAFPNLIALIALSGVVIAESKDYFRRLKG
ncbi:MAG: alanine:cation symporter family protein [Anaerocolumna sp.]|jgi:AGCS family alanine or glycine:cation symporter|nr:alanine:cation symporter family protein [Anaerocolumna sp.]